MTAKLTKEFIENYPLPFSGQTFIWDIALKGFGVKLTKSGRYYIVQRWVLHGKNRRKVIGKHGLITLQQARAEAMKILSDMSKGIDHVAQEKRNTAQNATLRRITDEYISAHKDLKASSIKDFNKHINTSFSSWKGRAITEITRERVAIKFRKLTEKSPAQANQAMRILRALF
jgi:hypothetical protein